MATFAIPRRRLETGDGRRLGREAIAVLGAAVLLACLVGLQALAFLSPHASGLTTVGFWVSELVLALFGLLAAVGLLLAPLLIVQGLLARRRGEDGRLISLGLLLLVPWLLWTVAEHAGREIRYRAAVVVVGDWQPVAEAVVAYEQEHETHPAILYPVKSSGYLADWPDSSLAIAPQVRYRDDPEPRMGEWPRWELYVSLPGLTHSDELFYWPGKEYPREVRGRSLHRIGDWLLVQG